MAPRPNLYPLKTSKNMVFPSELHENPLAKKNDEDNEEERTGPSVPPPLAYTEFLRALSPVFASPDGNFSSCPRWTYSRAPPSPVSLPSATSNRATFAAGEAVRNSPASSIPPSPLSAPRSASSAGGPVRRVRTAPSFMYSPAGESPQSPYAYRRPYSPNEWRLRYADPPHAAQGRTISIQHIVTHTVTLKHAPPPLAPPPKGKRRRTNNDSHGR
ncbi:uncharacterized protein LDX57_000797 [Aspergillus melleus]|uniref:uncharacterized protein n=1 Tax=Aspergillus melleus TaxID=138277 RepID=UPI001E8E2E19|nr:uncharacterized protein LDX57_000797 [Aspergillus melleus]KAH8423041.1 hypothetical protein LDX57_000797 [Aspergillus melleus]